MAIAVVSWYNFLRINFKYSKYFPDSGIYTELLYIYKKKEIYIYSGKQINYDTERNYRQG